MADPILSLALILLAAEAGGFITGRLGLTRVVGQIGAGLILGPTLLGVVGEGATIQVLSGIGALCILAVAGLETDLRQLRSVGRPALLAAMGGVAIPMLSAALVVRAVGYSAETALFCGAILTATSVGITAAALRELGYLNGAVGSTILAAAVIDDVLGLAILGFVTAETSGSGSPLLALVAMIAVLGGAFVVGRLGRSYLVRVLGRLHVHGGGLAAMLGVVLATAWLFQAVGGLAGITGAYVAGLLVAGSPMADGLRERLVHAGEAILVPIFFVAVGLSTDLRAVPAVLPLAIALLVIAVAGKLLGSGLAAWAGGLSGRSALGVGIGMIARGEVALVSLAIARTAGAVDTGLYGALVLVILATTILTPIGLAIWTRHPSLRTIVEEAVPSGSIQAVPAGVRMDVE
jgi:Kef-type K+ transport system membrane component KefB